jgi:predicted AAA+ superfamily ATPase
MLKTVKDACKLHQSTIDYQVAGGVENLAKVINATDEGQDFFEKSHMTSGMEDLLVQGLLRLSGRI